jgi:hypothetical protein
VDADVQHYLDTVTPAKRRRDALTLVELMERVTGQPARLHGTMVGFGRYEYRYDSGREGEGPAACFAPRKAASTIYVPDGVGAHAELLGRLGPHSTGVGCIYIKDLTEVDLPALEAIVGASYATVTAGTFGSRARESS